MQEAAPWWPRCARASPPWHGTSPSPSALWLVECSTPALHLPCCPAQVHAYRAWHGSKSSARSSEQLTTARLWLRLLRLGSPRMASRPPPPGAQGDNSAPFRPSRRRGGALCLRRRLRAAFGGVWPRSATGTNPILLVLARFWPLEPCGLSPEPDLVLDPDPDSDPIALALVLVLTLALWALAIGVAAVRGHDQRRSRAARAADLHRRGASRRAAVDGPALQHLPAIRCSASCRAARS